MFEHLKIVNVVVLQPSLKVKLFKVLFEVNFRRLIKSGRCGLLAVFIPSEFSQSISCINNCHVKKFNTSFQSCLKSLKV